MKMSRMYRYRIYPTPDQALLFQQWMGVLRFLWNVCHEQRLMALRRTDPVYVEATDQKKEMTLLQKTPGFEWVEQVQCQARQKIVEDLADAWERCFKGLARRPHWKSRRDDMRLYVPTATVDALLAGEGKHRTLTLGGVRYKQLGDLKVIVDRPLPAGRVTSWSITREVAEWYATAVVEMEVPEPLPSIKPAVGIDRGVTLMLADSEGRMVPRPGFFDKSREVLARAQRKLSRKDKGSKNSRKAALRVAKIQQRTARRREVMVNTESKHYADRYGMVVLEDLKIGNMTRSAKGTVEEPGTNVKQKSGLNRGILDSGWGAFERTLKYKIEAQGGRIVKVNPAYTSQTCPNPTCGHVDPNNRPDQATFRCTKCGYQRNADTVAAVNILARGLTAQASVKKVKQKMTRVRRKKAEPTPA